MNDPQSPNTPTPPKAKLPWQAAVLLAAIGAVFLGVGGFMGRKAMSFSADAVATDGVIVRLIHTRKSSKKPVVKYSVNGQDFEVTASVASNMPPYHVGEKLKVLYRPNNPADAVIDTFIERWLFPTIFGGIGAVLSLVGGGALLWKLASRFTPRRWDEAERFTIE